MSNMYIHPRSAGPSSAILRLQIGPMAELLLTTIYTSALADAIGTGCYIQARHTCLVQVLLDNIGISRKSQYTALADSHFLRPTTEDSINNKATRLSGASSTSLPMLALLTQGNRPSKVGCSAANASRMCCKCGIRNVPGSSHMDV